MRDAILNFSAVRGMKDVTGTDYQTHARIYQIFDDVAARYGFSPLQTPLVEETGLFERAMPDADAVIKELFRLEIRGDNPSTALRPEGTAPVMRALLQAKALHPDDAPLFISYKGAMFRYDRPQKGRLRQFHQMGVEALGATGPYADLNILQLASRFLKELNLKAPYHLYLNSLGDAETRARFREALIRYLTPYAADLSADSQQRLQKNPLRILDSKSSEDQNILASAPQLSNFYTQEAQKEFEKLCSLLQNTHIHFSLDPSLVRGLDYYGGTAFEIKAPALGAQSTVLGGGRYDHLSSALGGPDISGIGWAAGVERLALLTTPSDCNQSLLVLPCTFDEQDVCVNLCETLRGQRIPTIMWDASTPLKKRLKKAHQRGFTWVVIVGETERTHQTVTLKNMETGTQETMSYDKLTTHVMDHLKTTPKARNNPK